MESRYLSKVDRCVENRLGYIYFDLCWFRWTPGGLQVTFQVGIDLKIGGFSYEFAWN